MWFRGGRRARWYRGSLEPGGKEIGGMSKDEEPSGIDVEPGSINGDIVGLQGEAELSAIDVEPGGLDRDRWHGSWVT